MSQQRPLINEDSLRKLSEWASKSAEDARHIIETSGPKIAEAMESVRRAIQGQWS
jgi:hypothetical protein